MILISGRHTFTKIRFSHQTSYNNNTINIPFHRHSTLHIRGPTYQWLFLLHAEHDLINILSYNQNGSIFKLWKSAIATITHTVCRDSLWSRLNLTSIEIYLLLNNQFSSILDTSQNQSCSPNTYELRRRRDFGFSANIQNYNHNCVLYGNTRNII